MQHACKNFWDVTNMEIDPQNNKSNQIFIYKGLVRLRQNDHGQFPGKKWTFCEVLIIWFNTNLRFRVWLLLYLTSSKTVHLVKCELVKAWLDAPRIVALWVLGNPFSIYPKISERLILRIIIPETLNLTKILATKIQSDSSKLP